MKPVLVGFWLVGLFLFSFCFVFPKPSSRNPSFLMKQSKNPHLLHTLEARGTNR